LTDIYPLKSVTNYQPTQRTILKNDAPNTSWGKPENLQADVCMNGCGKA